MSRSNLQELTNPAKFFAEWSSTNKCFKFYQKSEEENKKGKDIMLELPFRFLVLDTLATIKGFSPSARSNFWSNEVRSTKKDELVVKTKKGEVARGLYDDIINTKALNGAKFSQSVYIMIKEKDSEPYIANIQMIGSAIGQWIEFVTNSGNNLYTHAVECYGTVEGTNGTTVYNKPLFKLIQCSEESNEQAKKLDIKLQEYLTAYLNKNSESNE